MKFLCECCVFVNLPRRKCLVLSSKNSLNLSIRLAFGFRNFQKHKNRAKNHEPSKKVEGRACWRIPWKRESSRDFKFILPVPHASFIMPNVFVMIKTKVQLNMTAMAEATPLISEENSSPIYRQQENLQITSHKNKNSLTIIHGIGPKPREKQIMNNTTLPNGTIE